MENRPQWAWLTGSGGLLVLLCFFMPWMSVSCGGQVHLANVTALDMAKGVDAESKSQDAEVYLWLLPLAGLLGIVALVKAQPPTAREATRLAVLGGIGALALSAVLYFRVSAEVAKARRDDMPLSVSWEYGALGTLAGGVLMAVGGTLGRKGRDVQPEAPS